MTADLLELQEPGSGLWTPVTNVNGRMIGDLRVLHVPDLLFIDLEPGTLEGGLLSHFRQQVILEDVELSDRTETTGRIGLFGDAAAEILGRAAELQRDPAELGGFDGAWGRLAGEDVIVQSNPTTGEPGFDIAFDRRRAGAVWDALVEAGGEQLEPVGGQVLETLRIEAGFPRFGVETGDDVIPLEAGMGDLISFEKGCYLGQEIIARLDTRGTPAKKLRTLVFDGGAAPHVEAEVEADGRDSGRVVSSVWSPLLEAPVALAYVKRNANDIGGRVDVEGREARVEPLGHPLGAAESEAESK